MLLLIFCCCIVLSGFGQETDHDGQSEKWKSYIGLNVGVSRFYMFNNPEAVKYPTFEMNLTWTFERVLFNRLYLVSGIGYHEQFKRSSYFFLINGVQATKEISALSQLDFATSDANRRALSIPVQTRLKLLEDKVMVDAGVLFRRWSAYKREYPDPNWVLNYLGEFGALLGLHAKFTDHLYIGGEVFRGFTNIDPVISFGSASGFLAPKTINQYAQVSVHYKLKKPWPKKLFAK